MKFTEAVFRYRRDGAERVYFIEASLGQERARQYLRDDPRNAGLAERDFEFVGFRPPAGPTDRETP